jgi:hypothetical protein
LRRLPDLLERALGGPTSLNFEARDLEGEHRFEHAAGGWLTQHESHSLQPLLHDLDCPRTGRIARTWWAHIHLNTSLRL